MKAGRLRNVAISLFVVVWVAVFQYETLRANYLSPMAGRVLPKLKFLYPPAGWIMFFNVDPTYSLAEVYGIRDGRPTLIDPHRIFSTRFVLYDNIRRNVLVSVLSRHDAPAFCAFLHRKFPDYSAFSVEYVEYPDLVADRHRVLRQTAYMCGAR